MMRWLNMYTPPHVKFLGSIALIGMLIAAVFPAGCTDASSQENNAVEQSYPAILGDKEGHEVEYRQEYWTGKYSWQYTIFSVKDTKSGKRFLIVRTGNGLAITPVGE